MRKLAYTVVSHDTPSHRTRPAPTREDVLALSEAVTPIRYTVRIAVRGATR